MAKKDAQTQIDTCVIKYIQIRSCQGSLHPLFNFFSDPDSQTLPDFVICAGRLDLEDAPQQTTQMRA
jgi:hypothetical protein